MAVILNPGTEAMKKDLQNIINKWYDYLAEASTDVRIVRDDYGDVVCLVPRIHLKFKDGSALIHEVTTGQSIHHMQSA